MTPAESILQKIYKLTERDGFAYAPVAHLELLNPLWVQIDPDTHNEAGDVAVRVTTLGKAKAERLPRPLSEVLNEGVRVGDTFPVPKEAEYLYHEAHLPLDRPLCNSPFLADHQRAFKAWWKEQLQFADSSLKTTTLLSQHEVLRMVLQAPKLQDKINTAMLAIEDKTVLLPRIGRCKGSSYRFQDLERGQCTAPIKKPLSVVRMSVYKAHQRYKGRKFTARVDEEAQGVRIWRVE